MEISPAYASKLIKKKNEEIRVLLAEEQKTSTTTACVGEDVEELRHVYNFAETQKEIEILQNDILNLKHAINEFNVNTILPGFNFTIDVALVRMKMLSDRKNRLSFMKQVQPVSRSSGAYIKQPEYTYRNFDVDEVIREFNATELELTDLQLAIDKANLGSVLDVNITSL